MMINTDHVYTELQAWKKTVFTLRSQSDEVLRKIKNFPTASGRSFTVALPAISKYFLSLKLHLFILKI